MVNYTCEVCKKEFIQKNDYTRHMNKKYDCLQKNDVVELKEQNEKLKDKINDKIKRDALKSTLSNFFKEITNILRDKEHITGDKALRTIAYILILRLSEAQINNGNIDITNLEHYGIDEDSPKYPLYERIIKNAKFSVLANWPLEGTVGRVDELRKFVLAKHPKFSDFFQGSDDPFRINSDETFHLIIKRFAEFPFEKYDADIQGEAYEEVVKDIMVGKVLGQFFTPPQLKQFMVELINPQIHKDGTIETIYDPALGTAGFLITAYRYLLAKAEEKNIKLDDKFISTKGLGGREAEPDTFRLAKANMLISSGHTFETLECGDSIRNPIKNKYDIVLANPPFGIKGMNYDTINTAINGTNKQDYMPIKSNSAIPLFLQAIISILKINGRCATVIPNGQDLSGKGNDQISLREYLMKTCDLKEIIIMPPGIFNNTGVKVCVFYFEKLKESKDVLKFTEKGKNITYAFSTDETQTKTVKFYDYDMFSLEKKLLIEVDIERIKGNGYSLNYADYTEKIDEECGQDVQIKTLGEVCTIENGKRIVKDKTEKGEYPVYGGGDETFYTNIYNRDGINCKISREGMSLHNCVQIIKGKFYMNSQGLTIKSNNENSIKSEYLWYYLLQNKQKIYDCGRGAAQKAIDFDKFKEIKIPIPSLAKQKELIEELDDISENNKTCEKAIDELKRIMKYYVKTSTMDGEKKQLNDLCEFMSKTKNLKASDGKLEGKYRFYSSSQDKIMYYNEYEYENDYIIIGRGGNASINYDSKFCISHDDVYVVDSLENKKYIYYYLKTNIKLLQDGFKGATIKHISKEYLNSIKLLILPLARQKEIVTYCDQITKEIQDNENRIKENNKLMKQILTCAIGKNQPNIDEQEQANAEDEVDYKIDENLQDKPLQIEKEPVKKTKVLVKGTKTQINHVDNKSSLDRYQEQNTILSEIESNNSKNVLETQTPAHTPEATDNNVSSQEPKKTVMVKKMVTVKRMVPKKVVKTFD